VSVCRGRALRQHEPFVAIAAFHPAALVDFQKNFGVAKGSAAWNITRPIAGDTAGMDSNGFRLVAHGGFDSETMGAAQSVVNGGQHICALVMPANLGWFDRQRRADPKIEQAVRPANPQSRCPTARTDDRCA
jgi:hypothetical protein